MKNRFLFLLAIVAMLFACSEDSTFTDLTKSADESTLNSEMKKGHNGKVVTKTIKLRSSGAATYSPSDECFIYGGITKVMVQGDGNASHLGLFTINLSYCINKYGENVTFPVGFLTAANGDKIYTHLVNFIPINPDLGLYRQDYEIDNGTGRFTGAYGEITLFVTFMENDTWSNYGYGEITY